MRTGSLTDTLCTRCGLCCDGSLFADVELARSEVTGLEILGLEVEEDAGAGGGLLSQPCGALRGTRCAIYAHRPKCCRTFECRLLKDVRRGAVSVEQALERIAEARKRITRVRGAIARLVMPDVRLPLAESCAEALASELGDSPQLARTRARLQSEWNDLEALLRNFLDPG